jgi:hypothetical protein
MAMTGVFTDASAPAPFQRAKLRHWDLQIFRGTEYKQERAYKTHGSLASRTAGWNHRASV